MRPFKLKFSEFNSDPRVNQTSKLEALDGDPISAEFEPITI